MGAARDTTRTGTPLHRRPDLLAAVGGAVAGAALFLLAHRGMPDDSYITLDYARNLALHGHWGLTPFRDANSATSPLNVWLLAAGILVTGRPVVAAGMVLVLATAALGWWSAGLARQVGVRGRVLVPLVVGLTVTSPIFASVVGMESFLGAAALLGVARYAAARRSVAAGAVLGLAVLTRPDLAVPGLVVLVALLVGRTPAAWRALVPALATTVVVALPWHLWSWFVLGGFVPDTLVIKTGGAFPNGEVFGNGPSFYLDRWPVPTALMAAVVLTGLVGLARSVGSVLRGRHAPVDRVVVACGVAGLAHYAVYAAMGVSSYLWYYCPSLFLLTVCTALFAADLASRRSGAALAPALAVVAGTALGIGLVGPLPWAQPVMFGNWATAAQYLDAGRGLGAALPPGRSVSAPGEIGALAYGCECDIVDVFSDHDRVVALAAERARTAGPVTRAFLQVNYLFSDSDPARPTDLHLRWREGTGPGWPTNVPGRGPGRLVFEAEPLDPE
ncbi:hypothetical protein [Actinomycetospora termitidis]|uniref:Glycosyltransferase RgtA/B/C/D-like domain-containing protein n=1 Tax=Actinomycetospora termitidis TaxID=3053470 RepID=A0ABT7M221_9PSEU|nr:hypothetical protein [Actinomycetospora sp. Odt1-22]MDL5154705.1 hypothetical protein [Actinomycetospora sp. Odt1-22]